MIHLAVMALAALVIGCANNDKDFSTKPGATLPPDQLPSDPDKADKAGAGPARMDSSADSGFATSSEFIDYRGYKKHLFEMDGDFSSLTEPKKQFQRAMYECYFGNVDAKELHAKWMARSGEDKNGYAFRDKEYIACLKKSLNEHPAAFSTEESIEKFFNFYQSAKSNLEQSRHPNAGVFLDRMKIYGKAFGMKDITLQEIEDRLLKAHEENLKAQ